MYLYVFIHSCQEIIQNKCKVQKKWGNQKYHRVDSTHNVSQHVCSDFVYYHQNVDLLINFLGFERFSTLQIFTIYIQILFLSFAAIERTWTQ